MPVRNYPDPIEGLTPGTIIITEETVETFRYAPLQNQSFPEDFVPPVELEVLLNGKSYILKCTHPDNRNRDYLYGDVSDIGDPIFDNNPVALRFRMDLLQNSGTWTLATPESGTYTISAKIPSASKVLSFPKGRTIVSELSRLNKAFGNVSKKKTIIGQLSDIADAAEAGKIGGGNGGALMVHMNVSDIEAVMDKTWQEIYDALKTTSVYIIQENEEEMIVATQHRIIAAGYSNGAYRVSDDNSAEYTTDSSDGYPRSCRQ